jgi:hypothetical protein
MPENSSRLPARASLEQIQKQAKELLRKYRAGDADVVERFRLASRRPDEPARKARLADAQFVIAREYGFATWAKLKHHVEDLGGSGLGQFEELAQGLAEAYSRGDRDALRVVNWNFGTSFPGESEPADMQRRLPTWFAAEVRTPELALADARDLVAQSYGMANWARFVESINQPPDDPRSAPVFTNNRPPFYRIDWKENKLWVRGPLTERDWETIAGVLEECGITRLTAGGVTDVAMKYIAGLDGITELDIGGSQGLTDDGVVRLGEMPQLRELRMGGPSSPLTNRGLSFLPLLKALRVFHCGWTRGISDAGLEGLGNCEQIEDVNLVGSPVGDGAIRALVGKCGLRRLNTGRNVTDAGIGLLHELPQFQSWRNGQIEYGLMSFDAKPTSLLLDGPFTDDGLAKLAGLDGLFSLAFFWHSPAFTSAGLRHLRRLANLGFLGCQGEHCDDEAMRQIAAIPRLRMLMGQGAVATDRGFEALSRSQSVEYIWGRECPNLTGSGFKSLAAMPALRGVALSCKNVDDAALSRLPEFPVLRELMPMDVNDDGFRHVGRCRKLENLWCMYCQETGDVSTEHIGRLELKTYYAGHTRITDRSLEILGRMDSLEKLGFWECGGLTDAGAARLARLPKLREVSFDGLVRVTRDVMRLFPAHVRVKIGG